MNRPFDMHDDPRRCALPFVATLGLLFAACAAAPEEGRGAGLAGAELPVAEAAHSYGAALRASFDLEPGLSLLLDRVSLPRGLGDGPGPEVSDAVRRAMGEQGSIQGTCTPRVERAANAPICDAPIPGYVVRLSEIYRLSVDTLQLHALVRRYDTPATAPHSEFGFEDVYQLVRRDGRWVVARKGRLARR